MRPQAGVPLTSAPPSARLAMSARLSALHSRDTASRPPLACSPGAPGASLQRPAKRSRLVARAGDVSTESSSQQASTSGGNGNGSAAASVEVPGAEQDLVAHMLSQPGLEGDVMAQLKTSEAFWKARLDTQLFGTYFCTHARQCRTVWWVLMRRPGGAGAEGAAGSAGADCGKDPAPPPAAEGRL